MSVKYWQAIEEFAEEPIISCVIGERWDWIEKKTQLVEHKYLKKVLDWKTAKTLLNYEYDEDNDVCDKYPNPVYVWTKDYVISTKLQEVDWDFHSVGLVCVPRNPTEGDVRWV